MKAIYEHPYVLLKAHIATRFRSVCFVVGLGAVLSLLAIPQAHANKVRADAGFSSSTVFALGTTLFMNTYSADAAGGVNTITFTGGPVPPLTAVLLPGSPITVGILVPRVYGPNTYGLAPVMAKPAAAVTLTSFSGAAPASISATSGFIPGGGFFGLDLVTAGVVRGAACPPPVPPALVGCTAAAETIDPDLVSPGTYAYDPTIDFFGLTVESPEDFAAVRFFASQTDISSGEESTIWELNISASKRIETFSDLDIDFFADESLLSLDAANTEDAIRTNLMSMLNFDGLGTVTLNDPDQPGVGTVFDVFSANYTPTSSVEFAGGLAAAGDGSAVSAVPVPAAVWLFSSGLLGLIGVAKHKKAA